MFLLDYIHDRINGIAQASGIASDIVEKYIVYRARMFREIFSSEVYFAEEYIRRGEIGDYAKEYVELGCPDISKKDLEWFAERSELHTYLEDCKVESLVGRHMSVHFSFIRMVADYLYDSYKVKNYEDITDELVDFLNEVNNLYVSDTYAGGTRTRMDILIDVYNRKYRDKLQANKNQSNVDRIRHIFSS